MSGTVASTTLKTPPGRGFRLMATMNSNSAVAGLKAGSSRWSVSHDSAGRRVPTLLPPAPAAARLRAHPQLRLPRQPSTRYALAALLPLTPRRSRDLSCNRIPCSGPFSLTLELPGLRWNHACRRTAFSNSTPASLPASPRVRCMNPQPQSRIILLLRHPQGLCVSARPPCPASHLSSLGQPAQSVRSRAVTAAHSRQYQLCKSSGPAQPYTKPIGSREGRLPSSRCI